MTPHTPTPLEAASKDSGSFVAVAETPLAGSRHRSPLASRAASPALEPHATTAMASPALEYQEYLSSYTSIRDFAYPEADPLHHGAIPEADYMQDTACGLGDAEPHQQLLLFQDGPPWVQDLFSPERAHFAGGAVPKRAALASEINQNAVALYDFFPENDNEISLTAGQVIYVSYRHGQGWLVAEDPVTRDNGLIPEEYVEFEPLQTGTKGTGKGETEGIEIEGTELDPPSEFQSAQLGSDAFPSRNGTPRVPPLSEALAALRVSPST